MKQELGTKQLVSARISDVSNLKDGRVSNGEGKFEDQFILKISDIVKQQNVPDTKKHCLKINPGNQEKQQHFWKSIGGPFQK